MKPGFVKVYSTEPTLTLGPNPITTQNAYYSVCMHHFASAEDELPMQLGFERIYKSRMEDSNK